MAHTPAETAQRTGLSIDTLRYYEREGLLGPVGRTSGGHREYAEGDLAWLGIVTCLRDAGLGIADLREFTRLLREEPGEAGDAGEARVEFLRRRRADLTERRHTLDAAIRVLDGKIEHFSPV